MVVINWKLSTDIIVTGFGKTLRIAIFAKIAIASYTSSTTLELTWLQVSDRSPVLFPRYGALCAVTRELLNPRNYGLKALLRTRVEYPYTTSTR